MLLVGHKGLQPVWKLNDEVLICGYVSGVQCKWVVCGPADANASPLPLLQILSVLAYLDCLKKSVKQLSYSFYSTYADVKRHVDRLILAVFYWTLITCLRLVPSVLWCSWLGGRKSIQPVENLRDEVLAWLCVWSEVHMTCIWSSWCHCYHVVSPSGKSRMVCPSASGTCTPCSIYTTSVEYWLYHYQFTQETQLSQKDQVVCSVICSLCQLLQTCVQQWFSCNDMFSYSYQLH